MLKGAAFRLIDRPRSQLRKDWPSASHRLEHRKKFCANMDNLFFPPPLPFEEGWVKRSWIANCPAAHTSGMRCETIRGSNENEVSR